MELILLLLLVVVFLGLPILSMRKQGKQINEIKSFQSQLEPGMIVQMTSGLHGRIDEVGPTTVSLELTPGVITTWDRSAVLKAVEPVEDSADFEEGRTTWVTLRTPPTTPRSSPRVQTARFPTARRASRTSIPLATATTTPTVPATDTSSGPALERVAYPGSQIQGLHSVVGTHNSAAIAIATSPIHQEHIA